jgi:putative endonuclease
MTNPHTTNASRAGDRVSRKTPGHIGREKEEKACVFLTDNEGYRIVRRNYRCKYGEIDIIAMDGNALAFVEVRYRREGGLVSALESLDRRKAGRLRLAVRSYISSYAKETFPDRPIRVDLCVITDREPGYRLLKGVIEF